MASATAAVAHEVTTPVPESKCEDAVVDAAPAAAGSGSKKCEQHLVDAKTVAELVARQIPSTPFELHTTDVSVCLLPDGTVTTKHERIIGEKFMDDEVFCCCARSSCTPDSIAASVLKQPILCIRQSQTAVFAMSDDTLYAWGAGQNGELPAGSSSCLKRLPVIVLKLSAHAYACGTRFVQLVTAARNGAILTNRGALFTWGSAFWGAGHYSEPAGGGDILRPLVPLALTCIHVKVACFVKDHAADGLHVITDTGVVLKGSNKGKTWTPVEDVDAVVTVMKQRL
jgi:hypothetical protein